MKTKEITKTFKLANWTLGEEVSCVGDITGMVAEPEIKTIVGNNSCVINAWINNETGEGYETRVATVPDFDD